VIRLARTLAFTVILAVCASASLAHETDHFIVPKGRAFADMGPYLTRDTYDRIVAAVRKTNSQIAEHLKRNGSAASLRDLQSADTIVRAVCDEYPSVVTYITRLEELFHSDEMKNRYPGLLIAHWPNHCIYDDVILPVDPRQFYLQWRSSTLLVNGIYVGTDKIGHFIHNGYNYYLGYRQALREGRCQNEAIKEALAVGAGGHLLTSERRLLGSLTSGVISNADLAANYVGFLFYLNLTQPVELRGRRRPPMLVMQKNLWRVNSHVRPDSDFFVRFYSEHFDEALNPNLYDAPTAKGMRKAIASHCRDLRQWYVDANGEPREQRYFDDMRQKLRTYYGQDYGHTGMVDGLVSVADVCFCPTAPGCQDQVVRLHEATRSGQLEQVRAMIAHGVGVNSTVPRTYELPLCIGATPLHVAAVNGQGHIATFLIAHGANVNARTVRSVTPLHKAVEFPELIDLLVDAGADVHAADAFGRTPLHWAARANQPMSVQRMISLGADVNAIDCDRETPLHHAVRGRHIRTAAILLDHGADVNARGLYGMTPLHIAADHGHDDLCRLLIGRGATAYLADEFGRTARDHAVLAGKTRLSQMLGGTRSRGRGARR